MKPNRRFQVIRHFAAAAAVLLLLSGCGAASTKNTPPCPPTGLMIDATHLTAFDPATSTDPTHAVVIGRIDNYRGACRFKDDVFEFALEIEIGGRKGPAAPKDMKRAEFPYFIAIVGPDEEVIQRQSFKSLIAFSKDGFGFNKESHKLRLPNVQPATIRDYQVAIGFELTPAQLAFNRGESPIAPKSLEKPAGKAKKKKK